MHKIDTRTLVDRVYEYMLSQISGGEIRYGDALNIKKIAEELGVSSMPVREAVKRLELEQLVTIKPRSVCRVRKPSRRMIQEVYELREMLELHALNKSLGSVKPKALERLRDIVARMSALHAEANAAVREKKAIELDQEFHSAICGLAENDYLNRYYKLLSLHVNMTLIHEKTYHTLEQGWSEVHAEILRCIEGRPQEAGEMLRRHFKNVTDLLGDDGSLDAAEDERGGGDAVRSGKISG